MPTTCSDDGSYRFWDRRGLRRDRSVSRPALAAMVEVTPSIPNEWDRWTSIGLVSIFCIMIGDFDTARQIWEDNDVAERAGSGRGSSGAVQLRTIPRGGRSPGCPRTVRTGSRAGPRVRLALLEHVANSEMAAVLAAEGRVAAAQPLLAEAIQTWVRVGDQGQLWTTLHHVVDVLLKAGQLDLAQELWHELRDRPGYISQTQRAALQAQLGEPREPTLTDDQLLARSRQIAGRLAEIEP